MRLANEDPYSDRINFYARVISQWIPDRTSTILIVGGGENDARVLEMEGFRNVTITNLTPRPGVSQGEAIPTLADAENLPYANCAFDYTVAHAVLHHCHSPHRALLELYRVASQASIGFEARDSAMVRIADWLGFGQEYEVSAVVANAGVAGGVRDTCIPNYIFRWTEREVEKTIASFAPHARHRIAYEYGFGTPCDRSITGGRRVVHAIAGFAYRAISMMVPKQRNLFAFCVPKPRLPHDLHPWLIEDESGPVFKHR